MATEHLVKVRSEPTACQTALVCRASKLTGLQKMKMELLRLGVEMDFFTPEQREVCLALCRVPRWSVCLCRYL